MPHRFDDRLQAELHAADQDERVTSLFAYFNRRGTVLYDGDVNQIEHALQAAALAKAEDSTPELVTAALLHDLGHLLIEENFHLDGQPPRDFRHEEVAAAFLKPFFPDAVTEPIRLHVPAKRYLCTVDPTYAAGLSADSQHSLTLQGGVLSADERQSLERNPHLEAALRLRRWDDLAKVGEARVPDFEAYRADVRESFRDAAR